VGDAVAAGRAQLSVSIRTEGDEAARAALEAARLFESVDRHADAARAYRAALHARPGCVLPGTLLAAEALAAGDAAAAADILAAAPVEELTSEAAARHARKLARALDAAGRAEEAERAWTAIFRGAPADEEAFARAAALALAARGVGGWVELAAEHEQALAAWGEPLRRRDLRHERGRLLAEAGRLEAARAAFLSALELDPGSFTTIEALSALDARRDDWAGAADALWQEAGAAADGAEAAAIHLRLARILSDRLGDEAGAIAALRAALARARSSSSPAAARSAAEAEALLGELGVAPEPPAAGAPPAPIAAEPGDAVGAVIRAQADAAEGPARADLLERLAAHLERSGDRDGAAEALASAIEADPHRDPTWSWLLALAPEDEERIARAEVARARAETEVSLAADVPEEAGAPWETAAPAHAEETAELRLADAEAGEPHEPPAPSEPTPGEEAPAPLEPGEEPFAFGVPDTEPAAVAFGESHAEDAAILFHAPEEALPPAPEATLPLEPEEASSPELAALPPASEETPSPEPEAEAPPEPEAEALPEPEPVAPPGAEAAALEAPEPPPAAAPEPEAPREPEAPEEAFAFGEPEAEAAVGIGVESRLRPITSNAPEDFARDGRLRMEAGDFEGAFERLSLALAREPSDVTLARDLSRIAERLGRHEEYVQLGEICADAIAAYDPLAAAARFRHFATVLRDVLGAPERASVMLEKALALVPDDADARRELVQLWASRPETAPRALDAWLEMARRDPSDAGALAGVAEVCGLVAEAPSAEGVARWAERGRIAASMAAFVAPATHLPPPRGRLARAVPPELRARVAVPGATGPLARLLAHLAPWLEVLFPADLRRRGAATADRLDAQRAPVLASALEAAARALSSRPHAAFLTSREGIDVSLENTQPPAVVASARVAELTEAALSFLSARTLDLLDHGWALAGKFSPKDVGILLELACRFAGGAPPSLGLPGERAGAFLAVLESQVPPAIRAAAGQLGKPAAQELAATDPRAFAAALRRTANRVGLLYAGDPGPALHALALLDRRLEAGPVDPAQALALPDLRDLALFALSEPFLDLRAAVLG
jgi:tetratricopeptide (TPR) repeat protein